MIAIQTKAFDEDASSLPSRKARQRKPLMLGSSGGGGHNTAVKGICDYLAQIGYVQPEDMPKHKPVPYAEKCKLSSVALKQIEDGLEIMYSFGVGTPLRALLKVTRLPVLPSKKEVDEEIELLDKKEERKYVDMLLDAYPAGHESAAIWNILQRTEQTHELKKLVNLQASTDKKNYKLVYSYFLKVLKNAALSKSPYTELISTQAMALPALCDAVIAYNAWLAKNDHPHGAPSITIHQYMTDLPTAGAVHFFKPLSRLTQQQQKVMKLYAVGLNQHIIKRFFPKGCALQGLFDIPVLDNPMIRAAFKSPSLDNSGKFHQSLSLNIAPQTEYFVAAHEQIASIMLGSQAGADTARYIETLIENGMDKVFVFGGTTKIINAEIESILSKHPEYADKIIRLSNQGDQQIAPLMTRSNIVIIRGGGLSSMEQMAIKHCKEQTVLIHHANSTSKHLSSGVSWEDENTNRLMSTLRNQGVYTKKTTPERAIHDIPQARLVAATKRAKPDLDPDDIARHVKKLSKDTMAECIANLKSKQQDPAPRLPPHLTQHLIASEEKARRFLFILDSLCKSSRIRLTKIIIEEVQKLEAKNKKMSANQFKFFTHEEQYNADKIVSLAEKKIYKGASGAFHRAIKSYKAMLKLHKTLSRENIHTSCSQKLQNFKKEFENKNTKHVLLTNTDNFFMRIIREIQYQLSKLFGLSMEQHLPDQLKIRKRMYELRANETKANRRVEKMYQASNDQEKTARYSDWDELLAQDLSDASVPGNFPSSHP